MGYASLSACAQDLERTGQLVRLEHEIDSHLEAAEIQRRTYAAGGPAIMFCRVRGCRFPLVSNLFGTLERARFIFRDALEGVRRLFELKVDPSRLARSPIRYLGVPRTLLAALPWRVSRAPVLANQISVAELPHVTCWPDDGGPFITLPQVYTEAPDRPGPARSNLGMYRVQLAGNDYAAGTEVGLHYQIHRGIGVHHAAARARGERLPVHVFVGGPPAMTLAAVMPLPEGLPELAFAGALNRRRVRLARPPHAPRGPSVSAEADFCLCGYIDPTRTLPEGPFGDHLGYYSLVHEFPVMTVERVYHRTDAVWPFTVVGRPPQEDTTFGALIHELTGPVVPTLVPGVLGVNAVDAAGVHPLLLAVGSERYTPYADNPEPQELLTQANGILGQGQMSLAKYLLIVDGGAGDVDVHDIEGFLTRLLRRFDPRRDLHFHTRTTIDTLDYSGRGFNQGSKLVIAAATRDLRELPGHLPAELPLPAGFSNPTLCMPGVVAVSGPPYRVASNGSDGCVAGLCEALGREHPINRFPLVVVCDDAEFCGRNQNNFLWQTFTRSNPAVDVHGIGSFTEHKHWGCMGSVVIDARSKPHHAPALIEDPAVSSRVDALAAPGGPLHGVF
ncbi:MAG: UbiD family decarboxylase [Myxococcales bacterium]|nr:UbiD family decarboxylase [Myxococcales bacterium]